MADARQQKKQHDPAVSYLFGYKWILPVALWVIVIVVAMILRGKQLEYNEAAEKRTRAFFNEAKRRDGPQLKPNISIDMDDVLKFSNTPKSYPLNRDKDINEGDEDDDDPTAIQQVKNTNAPPSYRVCEEWAQMMSQHDGERYYWFAYVSDMDDGFDRFDGMMRLRALVRDGYGLDENASYARYYLFVDMVHDRFSFASERSIGPSEYQEEDDANDEDENEGAHPYHVAVLMTKLPPQMLEWFARNRLFNTIEQDGGPHPRRQHRRRRTRITTDQVH